MERRYQESVARSGRGAPRLAAMALLAAGAATLVLAGVARAETAAEAAVRHFDPAFLAESRSYHDLRYLLWFVQTALLVGTLWILARRAPRLRLPAWTLLPWVGRALAAVAVAFTLALVSLPFSLIRFTSARHHGLRHDALPAFLADYGTNALISAGTAAVVAVLILGLYARFRRAWWGVAGLGLAILAPLYAFGAPLVLDPLFNRIEKLPESPLTAGIRELAARGGVPVRGVWVSDASRRTRAVNAYFTGFGPSRRIVLYDTLLDKLPADEVLVVVAHEVGHWRHDHVVKGLLLGVGGAILGMVAAGPILGRWARDPRLAPGGRSDPRLVFPAYALTVTAMVLCTPISNAVSRSMEAQADRASLELTRDPKAFVESEVRMARENLGDVLPPAWAEEILFTHPSVGERIAAAEAFR